MRTLIFEICVSQKDTALRSRIVSSLLLTLEYNTSRVYFGESRFLLPTTLLSSSTEVGAFFATLGY